MNDDPYAAIMARIKYYRAPTSLPPAGNLQAQAQYWVKNYNAGGKGTVEHYISEWHRFNGP